MADDAIIRVVFSWYDETGSHAKPRAHLPAQNIAAAAAEASSFASAAAPCSNCALTGYSLSYRVISDVPVVTGSQTVKVVGVLVFNCVDEGEHLFFEVPGLKANLISSEPPQVDVSPDNEDVQALAASIVAQGFCNPNGSLAASFIGILWRQDT